MVTVYPHASRSITDDISVVSERRHPNRRGQTYLLRPGPIQFTTLRVAVDQDLHISRWSCSGAVRTFAHLVAGTLHIAFPTGVALRVDGLPVDDEVVTVSVGGPGYSGSTLQQVCCEELILTGQALEDLFAGDRGLREALSVRCNDSMAVTRVGLAASALRETLREALAAGAAALTPTDAVSASQQSIGLRFDAAVWRRALVDRLRTMLAEALTCEDLLSTRGGHRRHALAREAERLIWRRIESGEVGGLSLDELCSDLGTTRRTLQLAFQDHFATPVGIVTRSARLQSVRAELNSGTAPAVSDAALRGGFEHLGRFAHYYRDFYGESPSTTLRCQRQRSSAA